jgi:hypothetical protein
MRPLDELARLWNDTGSRMPRASWMQVPWPLPVAGAAGGALLTLIATSASQVPSEPNRQLFASPSPPHRLSIVRANLAIPERRLSATGHSAKGRPAKRCG